MKRFAQAARRQLREQISTRLEQVLRSDSVEIREKAKVVEDLKRRIQAATKDAIVDQVAYTWFNRFCALRYMDVNHYTRIGTVSPAEGFTQPEILQEAKQGVIDESIKVEHKKVFDLLNGRQPSRDPQGEAYRLLLAGACNAWHAQMPFLFPEIEDYTELLMPDDLLSENSVLQGVRETLTSDTCHDVEVIGWLYQYYISERKDEVFAALKENQKIEAKDIPAATQLFTPHWIVRYLVENSLGRLWMLNHPDSKLVERMEYYIKPAQEEIEFLKISSPEEIKLCDPACGSGHMLTYAFDLLHAIYEEQGYDAVQIPGLILQKNLYGIEIDKRAGDLAAFALVMKAREKDKRFFGRGVEPNICVLKNITFSPSELDAYKKKVGHDLFTQDLWFLLGQFEQADNFGSLIQPQVKHPEQLLERLNELGVFDDLLLFTTNEKVKMALKQAEFLAPRYHVVVANPPYMGGKSANSELRDFANNYFPDSESDLFAMFIERNLDKTLQAGYVSMITMQSWMFLSSFEKLRRKILQSDKIVSMLHLGARAFDSIGGEVVSTTAFTLQRQAELNSQGTYFRLVDGNSESQKTKMLLESIVSLQTPTTTNWFIVNASEFEKIPGAPLAYWVSDQTRNAFYENDKLGNFASPRAGLATGDNPTFQRFWFEVSFGNIAFGCSTNTESSKRLEKWYPCNSGGQFRKWYGNNEMVVNWQYDGKELRNFKDENGRLRSRPQNTQYFFKPGVTWAKLSSARFTARIREKGFIFDDTGRSAFPSDTQYIVPILSILCSKVADNLLKLLNPSLSFTSGDIANLPISREILNSINDDIATDIVEIYRTDWNLFETSWDFKNHPLFLDNQPAGKLENVYRGLSSSWQSMVRSSQELEQKNNDVLISAYGLQNELSPEVPSDEISLNCNPYYRYGSSRSEKELEMLLLADTMKEFISFAVGCMFGRYSLDKPGLVLANAGDTTEDYRRQIEEYQKAEGRWQKITFMPDEDNAIPVLDGEWFEDDIVARFKLFLKVTFGTEHYDENLAFIEEAIGRDIRSYFVKDFYNEHVKMYKKRPIYWMFSSPKGSFNVLMYMHRYRPDTISVILNNYLRQYREKLNAHKAHQESISRNSNASQGEKTKALKEVEWIKKVLSELKEYEDEILYPQAMQKIAIDLDDGVKVNYGKFGKALKEIKGL